MELITLRLRLYKALLEQLAPPGHKGLQALLAPLDPQALKVLSEGQGLQVVQGLRGQLEVWGQQDLWGPKALKDLLEQEL